MLCLVMWRVCNEGALRLATALTSGNVHASFQFERD